MMKWKILLKQLNLLKILEMKQFEMKLKNKKEDFLVCYQGASLLGNNLASKGMNKAGEGFIRAYYVSKKDL